MNIYEFDFNGYHATVIEPQHPRADRKWIWKTEFLYAFDQAERALLDDGYYRVYYQISDMYGSPRAVSLMADFYQEVLTRFSLCEKTILFGFSRGGLYAFNFAIAHPEWVEKIYLDAPVLDLASWPPQESREHREMLAEYRQTEESFASFSQSPIFHFSELLQTNIPVMIVCGDADDTVPFSENGAKLIDFYRQNGKEITAVVKHGCNHHPHSLENVAPIVDFCNQSAQ